MNSWLELSGAKRLKIFRPHSQAAGFTSTNVQRAPQRAKKTEFSPVPAPNSKRSAPAKTCRGIFRQSRNRAERTLSQSSNNAAESSIKWVDGFARV